MRQAHPFVDITPPSSSADAATTEVVEAIFQEAAELFASLSSPIRLKIVCQLNRQAQTVQNLVTLVHSSQPNVSAHLRHLRLAGIVRSHRAGHQVVYAMQRRLVAELCNTVCMTT
ncbi:ArsR/SmtB family transcription factor [Thiomonas intermedia]|uniref:ArsR/SmtB family transcription factor n=1 Tax=Thiomonas intermedia TaxID=926 RepID=UPI001FEC89DE|nr:metalloregulator ArsR/SmtB family transcription factor [Thiomonas intermedia]